MDVCNGCKHLLWRGQEGYPICLAQNETRLEMRPYKGFDDDDYDWWAIPNETCPGFDDNSNEEDA